MSTMDDPNREAVGLAPIWTGAGDPPPEGRKTKAKAAEPEPVVPKSEPKAKAPEDK